MIPILYGEKEWQFLDNGFGRLADALTCEVTEERNGVFELEMDFPTNGRHFEEIQLSRQIMAKPSPRYERSQPFIIESISKTIDNIVHIYATHCSYKMSYYPVKPIANTSLISVGDAITAVTNNIVGSNSFAITTDKAETAKFHVDVPTSLKSILYGMEGSLLDCYGGTWEFDRYDATLRGRRGKTTDIIIRYGKDLTDIKYEESREEIYTGVFPYWKGSVQESGQSESHDVVVCPDEVVLSDLASQLPYRRDIVVDVSSEFESDDFETQPTKAQVKAKGEEYVAENISVTENISIDVSVASLWYGSHSYDTRRFAELGLCDEVTVIHEPYGIHYTGNITKTVFDVLAERYKSIEIGLLKPSIVDYIGGKK